MSAVDYILDKLGLGAGSADVSGLIPGVSQGYDDASGYFGQGFDEAFGYLEQGFDEAIGYLEAGEAEAADTILKGLGLSIDEREKWFDVASNALQPVIEFGQQYQGDARKFMDHAKELVFDPDAIYGTEMWEALKGQMVEAVTNSASAKSGLLSGNYLDELSKRVMVLGADFRNSEISNALSGFNSAMVPVQMGFNAQGQIANNAMSVGQGNAGDIFNAYSQIGGNSYNTGANLAGLASNHYGNLAGLATNHYGNMGQMAVDQASEIANLNLTQQLAEMNARNQNRSSLFSLAGSLLPYAFEAFGGGGSGPMSGIDASAGLSTGSPGSILSRSSSYIPSSDYGYNPYGW